MNLTELLITGYDGENVVMATSLTAEGAEGVLTTTDSDGATAVQATFQQATPLLFAMVRMLIHTITPPDETRPCLTPDEHLEIAGAGR